MALTQISTKGIKDGTITGSDLATNVDLVDNQKLRFGTSSEKGEIYNDGNDLFINHTEAGYLQLQGNYGVLLQRHNGTENLLRAFSNGSVELFYNNNKKFETTSYGNLSAAQVRVASSNASTVAFSVGDVGTGFYNSGSNAIGYSANGTQKWQINSIGDLNLADDVKGIFGDGLDLQIYHTGSNSNSNIRHINSAGSLYIDSANSTYFRHYIDSGGTISFENFAVFNDDGAVELYHDNSKKFETTSTGVTVTGNIFPSANDSHALGGSSARWQELNISDVIDISDNGKIRMGDGDDLQIYHDGSNSYIKDDGTGGLFIQGSGGGAGITLEDPDGNDFIKCIDEGTGGTVELYKAGTKRLHTTTYGIAVTGAITSTGNIDIDDNVKLLLGTGDDFEIFHNGSNSFLINDTGYLQVKSTNGSTYYDANNHFFRKADGTENTAKFLQDGAVELYFDGSLKFATTSIGVTVNGSVTSDELKLGNTEVLRWGSSDTAFIQGQDGASGYMKFGVNSVHMTINRNGTINLPDVNKITFGASNDLQIYHDGTHSYILNAGSNLNIGTTGGNNVQIYGQNVVRWIFTYNGNFIPAANNSYDIGDTSNRVRNIYTNDLNLSNEGSSNDIDGSWGSYTIQEGAENLFLINKRNGKKYKFNLTEVS